MALGLLADFIGLSAQPGIGTSQLGIIALGASVVLWGLGGPGSRVRAVLSRLVLVGGSVYLALWIVELLLAYPLDKRSEFRLAYASVPTIYEAGEIASYHHVPGFTGNMDDGYVSVPVAINSHGDRDAEPNPEMPADRRVLMVGDSFAFGYALTSAETIDARIESRAETPLEVYNTGTMGYGPGDTFQRMQETAWWRGKHVYYLFFENDLHNDNSEPGTYRMLEGVLIPVFRPDGTSYTEQERLGIVEKFKALGTEVPDKNTFWTSFALYRIGGLRDRLFDRDLRLTGYRATAFRPQNIEAALGYTEQMKLLAAERGATFSVVILPAIGEAAAQSYASYTQRYIDGLHAGGIEVVEPIARLGPEHYFVHDPHFNPAGADVTADVIYEHFTGG